MTPKTILITGASDGIGAAAAAQLTADGHRVLITGRSTTKTADVARSTGAKPLIADFTHLDDVRALATAVKAELGGAGLDVLANNAGGIFGDYTTTTDGYEKTFQVNHLAPFLLTHLLLDELRAGDGGSVVNTSSVANRLFGHLDLDDLGNEKKYSPNKAYGDAKLANILFTRGLVAHYGRQGISSVAFHPGNVATNFASDSTSLMRFVYRTPLKRLALISSEKGGRNLTRLVEGTPGADWHSGDYWDQDEPSTKINAQANDDSLLEGLWTRSASMVGLDRA